jgi:hypothetical protein
MERPGDFRIFLNEHESPPQLYIDIWLPIPGKEHHDRACLPIATRHEDRGRCWWWDGNREAPTMQPSIDQGEFVGRDAQGKPITRRIWHGVMSAGRLISEDDILR